MITIFFLGLLLLTILPLMGIAELLRRNFAWPKGHPVATYILAIFFMGILVFLESLMFKVNFIKVNFKSFLILGSLFVWALMLMGIAEPLRRNFAWPKGHPVATYILAFFLVVILMAYFLVLIERVDYPLFFTDWQRDMLRSFQ